MNSPDNHSGVHRQLPLKRHAESEAAGAKGTCPKSGSSYASSSAPPKPKRPRTAYNLFFKEQQDKIKELNLYRLDKKALNIPAVVSECWKKMTPSMKIKYDQLAAEDKFRYYNEKIVYQSYLEQQKSDKKRKGKSSSKAAPASSAPRKRAPASLSARHHGSEPGAETPPTPLPEPTFQTQYRQVDMEPLAFVSPTVTPQYDPWSAYLSSHDSGISSLADKLDDQSIAFLIKALK